jgi:hypothetical protein
VLIGNYSGSGASFEQVTAIFATRSIKLLREWELPEVKSQPIAGGDG